MKVSQTPSGPRNEHFKCFWVTHRAAVGGGGCVWTWYLGRNLCLLLSTLKVSIHVNIFTSSVLTKRYRK